MTLKNFLELVKPTEEIRIYDAIRNVYILHEEFTEDYNGEYDNCRVTGVETSLTNGGNSVLEIEIFVQ